MSGAPNFHEPAAPLTLHSGPEKIGSPTPRFAAVTGVRLRRLPG